MPGGWYTEHAYGGSSYHTQGGGTVYGDEAKAKAIQAFGKTPRDGITGEAPFGTLEVGADPNDDGSEFGDPNAGPGPGEE